MQLATNRRICAVWTVAFTVGSDGRATIHGYTSDYERGYEQEQKLPRCHLIEDEERTVLKLVVQPYDATASNSWRYHADPDGERAVTYDVANPQFVFSYGDIAEEE